MHDVVTHRVSLMVLQAGALGITATDDPTRRAAEELRAAGVQALDELRDLVGILRTAPEADRVPSAFGLAELVAESTAVGTPAELVEAGDPGLASPVVGRTAYRIVREALTNVRKHAPGAQVTVRVDYGDTQVQLSVRNTRPQLSTGTDLTATGSGLGLASLRQRVELVQGTLHAGWTPDGGFCLDATMPSYVPTAEPADMINVVVVDDEPMVCAHLRTILGSAPDIEVTGEAHDGAAGIEVGARSTGPTWC